MVFNAKIDPIVLTDSSSVNMSMSTLPFTFDKMLIWSFSESVERLNSPFAYLLIASAKADVKSKENVTATVKIDLNVFNIYSPVVVVV